MPRLILNADDFGLTPGVNRAIAELYTAGCLTSATLMANGAALDDALVIAKQHPGLGVGCHVVLTDGTPVLPSSEIPSLLGPDRINFRPTLAVFIRDLMLGRIREEELEREATAQMQKLQQAGIALTHFDTHKHTHLFPAVARPLSHAALACGVSALRNPFEPDWSLHAAPGSLQRKLLVRLLARLRQPFFQHISPGLRLPEGCLGISATGELNAASLRSLLEALPEEGTWEIVCHPGYVDAALSSVTTRLRHHREIELHALLAEIPRAQQSTPDLQLASYRNL